MPTKPGEGRKLGRPENHRNALLRNLATSIFQHERVSTTEAKAKELRRFADRLINQAKPGDLNARRYVYRYIQDKEVRKKIFEVLVPRYQSRVGGYTQIFHLGSRKGDNAKISLLKLMP
ncbi:MAG: 50S ribosomal protein L17 [Elusimicrobiota bacterium]